MTLLGVAAGAGAVLALVGVIIAYAEHRTQPRPITAALALSLSIAAGAEAAYVVRAMSATDENALSIAWLLSRVCFALVLFVTLSLRPVTSTKNMNSLLVALVGVGFAVTWMASGFSSAPIVTFPGSSLVRPYEVASLVLFGALVVKGLSLWQSRRSVLLLMLTLAVSASCMAEVLTAAIALSTDSTAFGAAVALKSLCFALIALGLGVDGFQTRRATNTALGRIKRRADGDLAELRILRGILSSSPDAIVLLDAHGRVKRWGPQAEAMIGYERDHATGEMFSKLVFPPYVQRAHDRWIERFHETGGGSLLNRRVDVNIRRANGAEIPVEMKVTPLRDGADILFSVFVRDVSRRQEVTRLKDEFVSTVSHELRTPLTAIYASLGLIEGGAAGPVGNKAGELVSLARQNCMRLTRLVNDLLDLERLEAGDLELEISEVDPHALVAEAVESVSPIANRYGIEVDTVLEVDDLLLGDKDRLLQVLINLLSNAIKFSGEGSSIEVAVHEVAEHSVRFAVRDQGHGISDDDIPKLFGRFRQLDGSDRRERGGTGLGLAISKAIVEQHRGEIGVESEVGVGSTFYFELSRDPERLSSAHR